MGNNFKYRFTVFTATYNRGHLLGNAYKSLEAQTFRDFEWVIVDDGSTDNTAELVKKWISENLFSIKYFKQDNSGKHSAFNLGVVNAAGELFLSVDSDDFCKKDTLEKFSSYWDDISESQQSAYAGLFCNCEDGDGKLVGSEFPQNVLDSDFIGLRYKYHVKGDKAGFFRTNILRQFPFPLISGERFLTEALVWNRISLGYKTRFVNNRLLVVSYQNNGLSSRSLELRAKNPLGAVMYYREFLSLPVPFYWKLRNLLNFIRFSFHGRIPIRQQFREVLGGLLKLCGLFLLLPGYIICLIDKRKIL